MEDVRLYVTGLSELRAALRRVDDPELQPAFREHLKKAGEVIAVDARSRVPVGGQKWDRHPGAARDSIRITAGGNAVYIMGGKAKVPYYGWLDFGGALKEQGKRTNYQKRDVLKGGRYIYPAIARHTQELANAVGDAFDEVTRRAGLT